MIVSIDDFKNRLAEIDTLLNYSRANQHSVDKYKLFNKIAIVLLCSHFEVFIESFIAEHVDVIKHCFDSGSIPQYMKDNYIDDTIRTLKDLKKPSKKQKPLRALFQLHGATTVPLTSLSELILDTKYSFGKHGQEETEKLFCKFGFGVFVETKAFKDSFKVINSVISIRNNIIHEGSAPTLSLADIITYKKCFVDFANELENHVLAHQIDYYGREYYLHAHVV